MSDNAKPAAVTGPVLNIVSPAQIPRIVIVFESPSKWPIVGYTSNVTASNSNTAAAA